MAGDLHRHDFGVYIPAPGVGGEAVEDNHTVCGFFPRAGGAPVYKGPGRLFRAGRLGQTLLRKDQKWSL